ncbi:hypothetical protein ACEPAF_8733 [Sanghuangporus sanghuang]
MPFTLEFRRRTGPIPCSWDMALGELQVSEDPFIALPLASTEDPQDDTNEIVPEEDVYLPPVAVANSLDSTRAGSTPCPSTSRNERCEIGSDVLHRAKNS